MVLLFPIILYFTSAVQFVRMKDKVDDGELSPEVLYYIFKSKGSVFVLYLIIMSFIGMIYLGHWITSLFFFLIFMVTIFIVNSAKNNIKEICIEKIKKEINNV